MTNHWKYLALLSDLELIIIEKNKKKDGKGINSNRGKNKSVFLAFFVRKTKVII